MRAGVMPPNGMPRADKAAHERFLSIIEGELDRAARVRPEPGAYRSLSPAESNAVPERRPRSAGPRHRRHGTAASRRCELWVRQHRRGPEDLADADGALPDGRAEDQPHRRRVAALVPEHRLLQGRRRSRPGRPAVCAVVRHARRRFDSLHVPDGCALHDPRGAVAGSERAGADLRRATAPRSEHRWGAGQRLHAAWCRRATSATTVRASRRRPTHPADDPAEPNPQPAATGRAAACAAARRGTGRARWRSWCGETVRDRRSETAPTESGRFAFR